MLDCKARVCSRSSALFECRRLCSRKVRTTVCTPDFLLRAGTRIRSFL